MFYYVCKWKIFFMMVIEIQFIFVLEIFEIIENLSHLILLISEDFPFCFLVLSFLLFIFRILQFMELDM